MLPITVHQNGYLLGKKVLILNDDTPQKNMINLCLHKGEDMRYGKTSLRNIDFPGEYEMDGIPVTCFEAGDMLHFLLRRDDQQVAIIRNIAVLEKESFDGIHHRLCLDKACKDAVENLELSGDITVLEEIA